MPGSLPGGGGVTRMGRDPPFAGLGRAGISAGAIAPDRGLFRPRSAPSSHDTQKQRSVVDWAQNVGEMAVESLDAINLVEMADEMSLPAPSQIQ